MDIRLRSLLWVAASMSLETMASVTVSPVSPYHYVSSENVIYYATTAVPFIHTSAGYRGYDVSLTRSGGDMSESLLFDISAAGLPALTGTQTYVIMAQAYLSGSTDTAYAKNVSIAAANTSATLASSGVPASCSSTYCQGSINSRTYSAVKYTAGETVRIGIFPKEICEDYNALYASDAEGCSGTALDTRPNRFRIRFVVAVAADGTSLGDTSALESSQISANIQPNFQDNQPTVTTCPSGAGYAGLYFPGDTQIYLSPASLFSFSVTASGDAPINHLLVVAENGAAPAIAQATYAGNDIVTSASLTASRAVVSGFINTTNGADNAYTMDFAGLDEAGAASDFCSVSTSTLADVKTSEIYGFMKQSQCFVATAAFGDLDAYPLQWLRRLRDERLASWSWGRRLVAAYYQASPQWARLLIENPSYRPWVLIFLIPFELMAIVLLYPVGSLALAFGGMGISIWIWRRR